MSIALLCSVVATAQTFEVDDGGNVEATSFTGDGSGLTGVSSVLQHGFFNADCMAGQTCFLFSDCPMNFEVTGGGFFINTAVQADRQAVTLHQTYRVSATQWGIEATNGSATTLDFFVTRDCARIAPEVVAPVPGQLLPTGIDPNQMLLACPEWDVARYVDRGAAQADHFCSNHGLRLQASGGGPLPIPLEAVPAAESIEPDSEPAER